MLESLVANILNRAFGAYVENFDPNQLNIGIWSGDVKLKNLKLKKESLDKLELPIDLKFGHLGELTLQIPWSNLKSKPVRIIIENVYLLSSAELTKDFNFENELKKQLRLKREKLDTLELIQSQSSVKSNDKDDNLKNQSFTDSLVTKIIDNLQITIKNIHFRYEDKNTFTNNPYSVGFTLKELSAVSTDDLWLPNFISNVSSMARKLLTLNSLTIYWDSENQNTIYTENHQDLLLVFQSIIEKNSSNDKNIQFLLQPVSGEGHLSINKLGSTESSPHYNVDLFFEQFRLNLNSLQYRDILDTMSQINWFKRTYKFKKFRPLEPVEKDPKKWLKYAFTCIFNEIHEKNYKHTWEYLKHRRDQRKAYIKVWKIHLSGNLLSIEDQKTLTDLENDCDYEDIKFYRNLARIEYKKEFKIFPKGILSSAANPNASHSTPNGWFSNWWGSSSAQSNNNNNNNNIELTENNENNENLTITDEQKNEFYEAIEFDENKNSLDSLDDLPRERVKLSVGCKLNKGSFSIKKSHNSNNLAEFISEGCKVDFYQRKDSYFMGFKLNEFKVEDGSDNTLYKHIVSVKPLNTQIVNHPNNNNDNNNGNDDTENDNNNNKNQIEPFFQVSFEHNPLDQSADSELLAKLNSMTIFHNAIFIESIYKFFKPPKDHVDTIGTLMNAAESTIQDFTKQTRIGLQYAFEEHKTMNCKMDLQAPLIVIPVDPGSWSSPVGILDAGHISIISDLVEKDKYQQIKNEKKDKYTEKDWERLNTYMYDKFKLVLQDAQILIGPNIKSTIEQLHSENEKPALILDHFDMNFLIELSIIPSFYNLPKMKIGGDIPRLNAMLSDYQYKIFMDLISISIPNFSDNSLEASNNDNDAINKLKNNLLNIETSELGLLGANDDNDNDSSPEEDNDDKLADSMLSINTPTDEQHQIEFNFTLDLIILSLKRCSDVSTFESSKLVDLVGENFRLKFYKTLKDMHVDLLLADLSIDDYIENSHVEEFKKLISSKNIDNSDEKEDLFAVDYTRTLRLVPYNNEIIECYDQDIKFNISDFKVVITRKSILTLLNFALNTFTDPEAPEIPSDKLRHNSEEEVLTAPQHIDINITMKSFILILNDDGFKLATLILKKADIAVFMLPDKMKITAKLGGLSLYDDVTDNSKKLISIQGDELADLYYETFDPETNTLPYSSSFKFETASMVVMFVEDSFSKIYSFLNQFQKMKYIYDRARDVALDQANNVEDANKMKFDILVRAPIFIFPKVVDPRHDLYDTITFNLGEIHSLNNFVKDEKGNEFNIINSSLTNTKISSSFVVGDQNELQKLEIIDKLDINIDIDYYDDDKLNRPIMIVTGGVTGNEIKLTELQAFTLIQILQSFPRVFSDTVVNESSIEEIENDATNANMMIAKGKSSTKSDPTSSTNSISDHSSEVSSAKIVDNSTAIKIDFDFKVPLLSLTLFNNTRNVIDISNKSLSKFSLHNVGIKLELRNNGNFKSDLHIKSFVVQDLREIRKNKFTDIIPEVSHSDYQFMASIKSEDQTTNVDLVIDSPRVIVALDYLFSLKSFADFVTLQPKLPVDDYMENLESIDETLNKKIEPTSTNNDKNESNIAYAISIIDPSIILLANPELEDSQAIVFKISQFFLNYSDITKLSITGIGMFLCKMSSYDTNRLRIVDDFSLDFQLDGRGSTETSFLTTITAKVEPLLMRLSLRDINLALEIFNNASDMYSEASENLVMGKDKGRPRRNSTLTDEISRKLSKYAPSIISSISRTTKVPEASNKPVIIVKSEILNINIEGFRLVLIGDVHELPILDLDILPFEIHARNWSTELEAGTNVKSLINIFNYSTSSWEPLLEPWSFGIHIEKTTGSKPHLAVNFISRDSAELTVTSRSIATISHFASLISDKTELKSRGEDSPYRIVNQTGYDLNIWIDDGKSDLTNRKQLTLLKNQDVVSWSFEDWRQVRESLSINTSINFIGIEFLDSVYNPIRKLSLKSEGEEVFMLTPILDEQYHNRLACEIDLADDKVKEVILKSTVSVENFTPTPIHIGVGNYNDTFVVDREILIDAGKKISIPIDYVYKGKLAVRPETSSEVFGWSKSRIQGSNQVVEMDWKIVRDNDLFLECPRIEKNGVADFYYFKVCAEFDKDEPLNQLYPHMTINITPPLVIENLLPFDIEWRLFQKGPNKWNDVLKKGQKCPIHVIDMHLSAVLKIAVLNSKYGVSAAAIVNAPNNLTEVDKEISLKAEDGQRLNLGLRHVLDGKFGGKVSIFSPYLIVNRTGKDVYVTDKFNTLISKGTVKALDDVKNKPIPDMFSFSMEINAIGFLRGNLKTNRAVIRVNDSFPSSGISIDKIGQSFEVKVGLKSRTLEDNVGVHITEGQGIYNLTKVIIITPRYVIRNDLDIPLVIAQVGSSNSINLDANQISPIYEMPKADQKQIMVGFSNDNLSMSSPFGINNIGEVYIRVKRLNSNAHMLLRVVISTENASIFISVLDAKNLWPYSIRNFSDYDFFIYQADPYVDKDGNKLSDVPFKPIYYKIPHKSVMPYAWDFPAAEVKELVIRSGNRERYIQLAEIGTLMPMKVQIPESGPKIVDLNVIADGPVQSLIISNYDPKTSMYQLRKNNSTTTSLINKEEFETNIKDENYYTNIIFKFEGLGISLINTNSKELCYSTIRGIELRYNESDIYQNLSLKLKWLQVDNQLYPCIFPIIIYPTVVPKSSVEMDNHPIFSTSIARLKDTTHGVNYIKFATMLLQELSIEVDEDFLWALLDFSKIPGAAWNTEVQNILWDQNLEIPDPPTIRSTDDLYFESLHLQPLQFNLSFVRTERVDAEDTAETQNALSVATNVLTMAIGNINDAPVRLSALFLENIRTPLPYLIQNISEHYKQAFLYQVYKVLGSADVLGNPVGLFNNISSGVMDIFYEPYQGFIMTDRPQELGIGLAKGGLSFLKKSVFGFSDSFSRFTSSMAKGLTAASMDKDFQERRRLARQKNVPNHSVYGLSTGANSLIDGISSGLTGLAMAPMEGATREGAAGFLKGLGKGLLGLPTKTATGMFDLANNISESIKNTTTVFDNEGLDKVRLPRYVPFDGSVTSYSERESQGQFWLKTCEGGKYANEKYLAHVVLHGGEHSCIISLNRILIVAMFNMSVDWQIPFDSILNIRLEKTGISIKQKNTLEPERFISIPDKADKRFLYSKITVAVTEFNKHCIVAL